MGVADEPTSVLFVCLGNICRSPTADGVLRHKLTEAGMTSVRVDSAGTAAWHAGKPPDRRSQAAAKKRGIDLSMLRARHVVASDFEEFDYILAMDDDNKASLLQQCPQDRQDRVALLMGFLVADSLAGMDHQVREVPDPYYGEGDGFELVLDLVEAACDGLIADIQRKTHEQT